MRFRALSLVILLGLALSGTGCGSEPATSAANAPVRPKFTGTDAGALSDLQASTKWTQPRCRWLETSAHILFYPQDTAVLMAARDLRYAAVEQVGTGNRIGTPEPAWSVALTDAGKTESVRCGPGSDRATVFGVPVSERRFISGKRISEPDVWDSNRTVFEVEFEWMPTAAGYVVKSVLTNHMAVEQGLVTERVVMLHGDRVNNKGPNGWAVQSITDSRPRPGG